MALKLPIPIAAKLLLMAKEGQAVPASSIQSAVVDKMLHDGVLQKRQIGRTRALIFIVDFSTFRKYLFNHFGVGDLDEYVKSASEKELSRNQVITLTGNSKSLPVRTFKGFLVNCYSPVHSTLHGKPFIISPVAGSFTFISDYETFIPDSSHTIVGIENSENFRYVEKQKHLFEGMAPLFVSRYPQSLDLVKWLQSISNRYLYFGDLDFAGIHIFLTGYQKYLGERAAFLIPPNTEELIAKFGNRDLYNKQVGLKLDVSHDQSLTSLVSLLHQYKKVLEQEVFIEQ